MLKHMSPKHRAVSPVIGTVLMIALVLGASAFVAIFIGHFTIPDYTTEVKPTALNVELSINNYNLSDSNADGYNDTLLIDLSLGSDSPTIYVTDVDILLPTGDLLDWISPWFINGTTSVWSKQYNGYVVIYGSTNVIFNVSCSNLSETSAQLASGQLFYYLINYHYISSVNGYITTVSAQYQSELLF